MILLTPSSGDDCSSAAGLERVWPLCNKIQAAVCEQAKRHAVNLKTFIYQEVNGALLQTIDQ